MHPDLAVQLCKSFIQSKLECGTIMQQSIRSLKHMKLLDKAMESAPTEALESELNIAPIDLRLEELQ